MADMKQESSGDASTPLSYLSVLKRDLQYDNTSSEEQWHSLSYIPVATKLDAMRKVCPFFLQGTCRYGDYCRLSHQLDDLCPYCCGEVGGNLELHFDSCEELKLAEQERIESADLECGICHEIVLNHSQRFGLLPGCNHAFCLQCIREWRGTLNSSKQTVRKCPICRLESHFVVPSDRMVVDPVRKGVLIDKYKEEMHSIPCRWFNYGRGSCPFGTSCFYAHLNPDGTPFITPKLRHLEHSEGVEIFRAVRLCDFFQ